MLGAGGSGDGRQFDLLARLAFVGWATRAFDYKLSKGCQRHEQQSGEGTGVESGKSQTINRLRKTDIDLDRQFLPVSPRLGQDRVHWSLCCVILVH